LIIIYSKKFKIVMNKFLLTTCIFLNIFFVACSTKNKCDQLPQHFSTFDDALTKIKLSNFKIHEDVNTSKSSWIKAASFYSCDGNSGYFIIETAGKEYLYAEMPYNIWIEFKSAQSFGTYYNKNIKHKYTFTLTK
jgi:hypothetical protein